ncbi:MAG: hypothetical protein RLZZ584_4139 [Pseudomonadota bacterium]|jgi:Cu(I)/Ag(I) efflux system membrane fusion protein
MNTSSSSPSSSNASASASFSRGTLAILVAGIAIGVGLGVGLPQLTARLGSAGDASHGAGPATAAASGAGGGASASSATAAPGERKVLYWYDPMVPTQRFDQPGKSPFMDMQLVPRYADESGAGAGAGGADEGPALAVPTAARQALGLRLATVTKRALASEVLAVGSVSLNERDISIVQARSGGFVEKVYARAPGDVIAAGAPLVDLLTPEWLAAQQEYLAVRATGDAALTKAARQRMVLLGMPAALIDKVEASGAAQAVQTLTAPSGGVIAELMVRAGMTVGTGMTLARINGLGTVWLEAAVPEAQAATVRPGQLVEATFPALPGEKVKGRVAAILPEANRETRTLRVRIELPNPGGRLKAGLYAQVALRGASAAPGAGQLVVPAEAVIRTGKRALVYIAEPQGRFRPVEVEVGEQVDEFLTVRSGLAEGQQVVASGQFLLDSEASLQGVMARSQPVASTLPAALGGAATTVTSVAAGAAPTAAPTPASPATHDHATAGSSPKPAPAAAPAPITAAVPDYGTQGVIVEIEPGSITLEHQPVPALKWPGMEMPFKLADQKLVKGMKAGQSVDFRFIQKGDDWQITRITQIKPKAADSKPKAGADPHAGHVMPSGASK